MRISGVTIPEKKRLAVGLTVVYGIGISKSKTILNSHSIDINLRPKDLNAEQQISLRKSIEKCSVEGVCRREKSINIKRLKDIACYRGRRHSVHLPVRGQRTRTNARTLKGPKKTMGSGKIKLQKK